MYVCLCKGLRETDVKEIALAGMVTAETLVETFGLEEEDCCGRCAKNIYELVELALANVACGPSNVGPSCARMHSRLS